MLCQLPFNDFNRLPLGACLILCSLLETRGREEEIVKQSTLLVHKIHGKLLLIATVAGEMGERALMAVRILASHNAAAVIDSLLAEHSLPFDDAVVRLLLFPYRKEI